MSELAGPLRILGLLKHVPGGRYVQVGLPLFLLAAGLFGWLVWPSLQERLAINGLATNDPKILGELRERLRSSDDPATDDRLADAAADGDKAFLLRERCAELLLRRNRLVRVEALARSDDLMTRAVALHVLVSDPHERGHFHRDYVAAPEYRVEETVRTWVKDTSREARHYAISLALFLSLPDTMEVIRPLLTRANAEGAGRGYASETLAAAVGAVVQFHDCASVEAVLALASGDPQWAVRGPSIDALEALCLGRSGEKPLCPDALPAARLATWFTGLLDEPAEPGFARSVRIKALDLLRTHAEYATPNLARIRAILDGTGNGAERRAALATLVAAKDAALLADFPRYVHDPNFEVRSTAVEVAGQVPGLAAESLWIGILRDETRSYWGVYQAHGFLKEKAGRWLGLPEILTSVRMAPEKRDKELERFLEEQLRQGTSMGVDREAWTTAWYRWFAEKQGLEGAAIDQVVAARKAFRAAMDRSDVAAAKQALGSVPDAPAPLFVYEQAWLATRP